MENKHIKNNIDKSINLDSLNKKIEYNRDFFKKELYSIENGKDFIFNISIDSLIDKIHKIKESDSITDVFKYKNINYSLHCVINSNENKDNDYKLYLYNKENKFDTFRAENPHIAGWVGQGGYTLGDNISEYYSEDHWGVSVSTDLRGSGFADVLYNLKCQFDNQLEFEHVPESYLQFLTFYIKKGYVPYSLIELDPEREEFVTPDILSGIILSIKKGRNDKMNSTEDGVAIKLRLDPIQAKEIYEKIK